MTKLGAIDESRLKGVLRSIHERKRLGINQIERSQRSQIAKLRRDLGKRLEPLFVEAGIDVDKINQILAQNQANVREILEKQKAKTANQYAALNERFKSGLENRKKAIEEIAGKPYLTTPVPILSALTINAFPAGILNDSHIEPANNWAKFGFEWDNDSSDDGLNFTLNFYFAWQNPSNENAVINCHADLVCTGIIQVLANPGLIDPSYSSAGVVAELRVFVGETEIYDLPGQWVLFENIHASGGWGPLGDANLVTVPVSRAVNLSCNGGIQVPGGEIVVFEVTFNGGGEIDGEGQLTFDFDFDPAGFKILCPGLNIDLLVGGGHH